MLLKVNFGILTMSVGTLKTFLLYGYMAHVMIKLL